MKIRDLPALACLLTTLAGAAPVLAGVAPYVRLEYGGNELRMSGANREIREDEAAFRAAGLPATFQEIGAGYGPAVSAGVWVLPGLRLGATYSYLRAVRSNGFTVPGVIAYGDQLDLRMTEIGAEAAVRFRQWAGFTVGANVARGRGELIESGYDEEPGIRVDLQETASRTQVTWGAFVGFDQTNPAGIAGFVRAGFQFRDLGHLSGRWTSDVAGPGGTTAYEGTDTTPELDFSGFYVRVGVGYDLVR